jgi:hypothetical protein
MANLIYKTNFSNVGVSGRQLTNFPLNHAFVTETGSQYSRIWMDNGTHETDSPPARPDGGLWVGIEKQSGADRIEFNLNNIQATLGGKNEWYMKYKMYLQPDFAIRVGGWFSLILPYQIQDSPYYPYGAIQIFNEASGVSTLLKLSYGSDYYQMFWRHYPPLGREFEVAFHVVISETAGVLEVWLDGTKVVNMQGYANRGVGTRNLVSLAKLYTSGETRTFRAWVTDLEVWDGIPDVVPPPPPPPQQYTLSIQSTTGGTTNPTGNIIQNEGTSLTVTATPLGGSKFDYWTLDGVQRSENPITVSFNANHALIAYFSEIPPPPPQQYTLSIQSQTGGLTDPTGNIIQNEGTSLTVIAIALSDFQFDYWILDGVQRSENPITVSFNANHALIAYFSEIPPPPQMVNITILPNPNADILQFNGNLSWIGTAQRSLGYTGLWIQAALHAGYQFDHWTVNGVATLSNPYIGTEFPAFEDQTIELFVTEIIPPPVYTCPICGDTFATQEELDAHIAAAHPTAPPKSGQAVFRGHVFLGYAETLPKVFVRLLWKLRERLIQKEVHEKLHPLI